MTASASRADGADARAAALGIDLGTGSVKALLLDARGRVVAEASRPYPVEAPRAGWAETDPARWWAATGEAVRACLQRAAVERPQGVEVVTVGLSGQMHGVVLCRADGTPVRPAVLWADGRGREVEDAYRALPEALLRRLGNPVTTGMAGPSLVWLLRHEPAACREARYALQPKDWLRLRLTGEVAAEPSDASATLLYDLSEDRWSHEVADAVGVPKGWLAPLSRSGAAAGRLTTEAAEALGLPPGLPVAAGAADTACAILGSGLERPGQVQVGIGTGMQAVALRARPEVDPSGRTHLFRSAGEGWYAMAAMQNAGLALEWVRGVLGLDWDRFYAEAFAVPAGAEGLSFLPYLAGERTPLMDADARGSFVGLSLRHGRGHLARAAFEGVAFSLRDGLEALEAVGVRSERLRVVGGGSLRLEWRQLLADVVDRPLDAVAVPSASARGAAALGWSAVEHACPPPAPPQPAAEPRPDPELDGAFARFRGRYREERERRLAAR